MLAMTFTSFPYPSSDVDVKTVGRCSLYYFNEGFFVFCGLKSSFFSPGGCWSEPHADHIP